MIKFKNTGEFLTNLRVPGAAATTGADALTAPFNGYISSIEIYFGVMGTDGTGSPSHDITIDIKQNGTSLYSAVPTWTHANQVGTANTPSAPDAPGTLSSALVAVNKGDDIALSISQILNGTSPVQPEDLCVWIGFSPNVGQDAPSNTLQQQITPYL